MKTTLINKTAVCEGWTHQLLVKPPSLVSLVVTLGVNDEVLLLQVGLEEGQVYVFDVKENAKLIIEGQLWRLLQTPDVVKVMHDGDRSIAALLRQFSVCVRSVYDTQEAYALIMETRGLPARRQTLVQLYHHYGDTAHRHCKDLKDWAGTSSMSWAQRPLTRHLVDRAGVPALCLLPAIFQKLQDVLSNLRQTFILEDSSPGQRKVCRFIPGFVDLRKESLLNV